MVEGGIHKILAPVSFPQNHHTVKLKKGRKLFIYPSILPVREVRRPGLKACPSEKRQEGKIYILLCGWMLRLQNSCPILVREYGMKSGRLYQARYITVIEFKPFLLSI